MQFFTVNFPELQSIFLRIRVDCQLINLIFVYFSFIVTGCNIFAAIKKIQVHETGNTKEKAMQDHNENLIFFKKRCEDRKSLKLTTKNYNIDLDDC